MRPMKLGKNAYSEDGPNGTMEDLVKSVAPKDGEILVCISKNPKTYVTAKNAEDAAKIKKEHGLN